MPPLVRPRTDAELPDRHRECDATHGPLNFAKTPTMRIVNAYLPLDGVVSLVASVGDRPPIETALIGSEGMLGATLS